MLNLNFKVQINFCDRKLFTYIFTILIYYTTKAMLKTFGNFIKTLHNDLLHFYRKILFKLYIFF